MSDDLEIKKLERVIEKLRKKNTELEKENIELRAQLRVIAPVGQHLAAETLQIARERAIYQMHLNDLIDQLFACHDEVIADMHSQSDELGQAGKFLEASKDEYGLNYMAQSILRHYHPIEQAAFNEMADLTEKRKLALNKPRDRVDADVLLNEIIAKTRMGTIWEIGKRVFVLSSQHTKDPRIIAIQIIDECERERGNVSIQTISRLDIDWIKSNISDRIGSHSLLLEAVKHGWRYYESRNRKTQLEYAADNLLSMDNLRKYVQYYDKLKEFADIVLSDDDLNRYWREMLQN